METLWAQLSQLLSWIGSWVPRLLVVRQTHGGVKFVRGKNLVILKPGINWYWPLVTQYECWPVSRQTVNLSTQTLETSDGHAIIVGGVISYSISDPIQAFGQTWDFNEVLSDISMLAIAAVVSQTPLVELRQNFSNGTLKKSLTRRVRKELKSYGVKVSRAYLSDFAQAMVLRTIGNENVLRTNTGTSAQNPQLV